MGRTQGSRRCSHKDRQCVGVQCPPHSPFTQRDTIGPCSRSPFGNQPNSTERPSLGALSIGFHCRLSISPSQSHLAGACPSIVGHGFRTTYPHHPLCLASTPKGSVDDRTQVARTGQMASVTVGRRPGATPATLGLPTRQPSASVTLAESAKVFGHVTCLP